MDLSQLNHLWLVWFYILVCYPFKVYDLFSKTKRRVRDFIEPVIATVFILFYVPSCFSEDYASRTSCLLPYGVLWVLFGLAYLSSVSEAFSSRRKRDYVQAALFTVALIVYIIILLL